MQCDSACYFRLIKHVMIPALINYLGTMFDSVMEEDLLVLPCRFTPVEGRVRSSFRSGQALFESFLMPLVILSHFPKDINPFFVL